MDWPGHLLDQILNDNWVLFLGAGVSANAKNAADQSPLGWADLLRVLADGLNDAASKAHAVALVDSKQYLRAAQYLEWSYEKVQRREDYLEAIRRSVAGPAGDLFKPDETFSKVVDLEPTIVVTTNYDNLFQSASENGYKVLSYDSPKVASEVRRGKPILLKIHGTIDHLDDIVLTRSDYADVRSKGQHAFEVLRALFLTRCALFVGYGLDDPDVELVLELGASGYVNPESHYVLMREPVEAHDVERLRKVYGVAALTFPADTPLSDVLEDLVNALAERGIPG